MVCPLSCTVYIETSHIQTVIQHWTPIPLVFPKSFFCPCAGWSFLEEAETTRTCYNIFRHRKFLREWQPGVPKLRVPVTRVGPVLSLSSAPAAAAEPDKDYSDSANSTDDPDVHTHTHGDSDGSDDWEIVYNLRSSTNRASRRSRQ